jgi:hypothetical protein
MPLCDREWDDLISHSDLMPTGSFEDVNLRDAFSSPSSASDPVQSDTQLPEPQDVPGGSQSQQLLIKRLKPNTS